MSVMITFSDIKQYATLHLKLNSSYSNPILISRNKVVETINTAINVCR
jgi:hypothetical protein